MTESVFSRLASLEQHLRETECAWGDIYCNQQVLAWADALAACLPEVRKLEKENKELRNVQLPICLTCGGRGWIMKSESRDLGGGIGAGGAWNEPCPICSAPKESRVDGSAHAPAAGSTTNTADGYVPTSSKSENMWREVKQWLRAHPEKTHGVYTPDGMYLVTFKPHENILKSTIPILEAPYCEQHGVIVADNESGHSWHCAACPATSETLIEKPPPAKENPMNTDGYGEQPTFPRELESLINQFSQENESNTPDYILAQYLLGCLSAWNRAIQQRETWYGRDARPATPPEVAALDAPPESK